MDLATVVGIVLGFFLVVLAILFGGDLGSYLNAPAVLIVVGGATAATMASQPLARFLSLPKIVAKTLFNKTPQPAKVIRNLVELAEVARRDGILALEGMIEEMNDEFLVRGIHMAVDGTDPEIIQAVMETELENLLERHEAGKSLLDGLGRYAPAFGMIGTLVGLVAMLSNMDDPSKIGAGMAAALLTTLYGALLANVLFLPLADKLALRSAEEALAKTIVIHGVMSIQSGDNPRTVESKLITFLPPAQRTETVDSEAA
ncbi:MAG: MotA/TolQ/ExbB proton channel family protein [Planctomycetes bacterium]|nr:MotA/TolQ/ExbB proton channel family protein [Planctomycetota bacterium]